MKLKALLVGDPVKEVAQLLTDQCERLAEQRVVTTTGRETLQVVQELRPEVAILSLELTRPDVEELAPKLLRAVPELLIIAAFRELTVRRMEQLGRVGVDDFAAQPVDATEVFRAVSNRFNLPFRRHDRYAIHLDVLRADGVLIGRTLDISEGGMRIDASHPMVEDESLLVDLVLPDGARPLRVRCRILNVEGRPPTRVMARAQFENLRGEEHRRLATFLNGISLQADASMHQ